MPSSPTQRTLALLRSGGWTVGITEHWNPHARIRQDLFGFVDVLALRSGSATLAVQCTSGTNHSARVSKILELSIARLWLSCGNRIRVISWSKRGPRGRAKHWEPRIQEITLQDFETGQKARAPLSAHLGSC